MQDSLQKDIDRLKAQLKIDGEATEATLNELATLMQQVEERLERALERSQMAARKFTLLQKRVRV